jgi:D-tyrosyl-tRNA(Tyr) deacylase
VRRGRGEEELVYFLFLGTDQKIWFIFIVMRAVIQRVRKASVEIDGMIKASVSDGLLVLLGIEESDGPGDIEWLSGKIIRLRIFGDDQNLMNLSVQETGGDILVVSQFTLHASTKKGNRPSFIKAARPEQAIPLYEAFLSQMERDLGKAVQSGIFGADMKVSLLNDGPVTIIMDSKNKE